ncbi:MAG: aminotransferase class V-fold PLP-dependent enzyme [Cyclobacteriaceae bacterium]|nr:aminotransferase class V-fold PLP-dependent enzyme [Cyclobacteriaceae bacterium]
MISFYPGPSKVYEQIPEYVQDAYNEGIVSINHRSEDFVSISQKTIHLLKEKIAIPDDYTIFFVSSATECWEIIAQSLIKNKSRHYFNGAFGRKWHEYTQKLSISAEEVSFQIENALLPKKNDADVICITQNETSNGTAVSNEIIAEVKQKNPDAIIAIDATSSMGGVALNFQNADVWFASVQKCFGLPAGLAIMACSPRAIERSIKLNRNKNYNSLTFMIEKMKDFQTTYTPNVLSIYLLMRTLMPREPIAIIDTQLKTRHHQWVAKLNSLNGLNHLIKNKKVHSTTVIPVISTADQIKQIKLKAKSEGFLLGNGYGNWSETTFRIANFPAITDEEINNLQALLFQILQ